jgi:nanoRNase/pAp phosphatase (c-di-AMP/oligoRNAs hydrolase)
MLKSRFENFLGFIKNKNIIIVTHDLVDIDGLASCFSLKYFLTQYIKKKEISIYLSELSKSTKNFLRNINKKFPEFDFSYDKTFNISKNDAILIVDTNNLKQIKIKNDLDIMSLENPLIYIDHHYYGEKLDIDNAQSPNLLFEHYSSTVEIILELLEYNKTPLTVPLKMLMIAAMVTDSGFFKYGNNKTIQNVSKLLGEDINIQDVILLLKSEIHISERIAKIKGMQRVRLIREGDFLIGISNVSSFGAGVAAMLINLGFDVAIVLSKEENQNRISTRAKKVVCKKTGLHLGKILEEISREYKGSGGGHDGAASLTSNIESETIIARIIEKIKQYL